MNEKKPKAAEAAFSAKSGELRTLAEETIEFLYHLFQFHSSTSSAKSNINADSTGLYRMAKLFFAVDGIQEGIVFEGKAWIDEKYVPVWKSAKARNADGDAMRGLSRNQICVCTAATKGRSFRDGSTYSRSGTTPRDRDGKGD